MFLYSHRELTLLNRALPYSSSCGFQTLPCRCYIPHIRPLCSFKHPPSLDFCCLHHAQLINSYSSFKAQLNHSPKWISSPVTPCPHLFSSFRHTFTIPWPWLLYEQCLLLLLCDLHTGSTGLAWELQEYKSLTESESAFRKVHPGGLCTPQSLRSSSRPVVLNSSCASMPTP